MKGFSLLEILIAVVIFSVLVLAVFAVMDAGMKSWFTGDITVELRREIIKATTKMEAELKELRPAQIDLGAGDSASSLTFKIPQDNDSDGTILDSLGNIEWSADITYALNVSGQITRTASGATEVIANNIADLQFSRPASPVNLLVIDITAQKTTSYARLIRDSGQVTIKMRN